MHQITKRPNVAFNSSHPKVLPSAIASLSSHLRYLCYHHRLRVSNEESVSLYLRNSCERVHDKIMFPRPYAKLFS
jgi:hypothetical protein